MYTISSTKCCEGRQHLSCLLKFTQTQHQTYLNLNLYIRNTNFGKPYNKTSITARDQLCTLALFHIFFCEPPMKAIMLPQLITKLLGRFSFLGSFVYLPHAAPWRGELEADSQCLEFLQVVGCGILTLTTPLWSTTRNLIIKQCVCSNVQPANFKNLMMIFLYHCFKKWPQFRLLFLCSSVFKPVVILTCPRNEATFHLRR